MFGKKQKIRKTKIFWNIAKAGLSIALIWLLIEKVGWQNMISTFSHVNFLFILVAILLQSAIFMFEAFNLYRLTHIVPSAMKYITVLKYHLLSLSISFFTPGRLGQFSVIYLLQKEGISLGEATAMAAADKIITMVSLSLLSVIGAFTFLSLGQALRIALFIMLVGLIGFFLVLTETGRLIIKKYFLRHHAEKFTGFGKNIKSYYQNHKLIVFKNLILNLLKWCLTSLLMIVFFLSVGQAVNPWYIFAITPVTIIISFIPVSINGIGLRESAAVLLYSLVGIGAASVFSAYILSLVFNYLVASVVIALFFREFGRAPQFQKKSVLL